MRRQNQKLVKLAICNVQMGLQLIETSRAYSGNIRFYKASVFSSLSSILEALSGIFLQLAILKNGRKKESVHSNVFYEEIKADNPLLSTKKYLHECLKLLASKKRTDCGKTTLTAMECRAQTFSFEMAELSKKLSTREESKPHSKI
jgi:hypothetical protein